MVANCALCNNSSSEYHMYNFPANSRPELQAYWVACQNLSEERKEHMLDVLREERARTRVMRCSVHFNAHGRPIDLRGTGPPLSPSGTASRAPSPSLGERLADCGDVMGLALPAARTFHGLLVNLVIPSVDHIYISHMKDVQSTVRHVMDKLLQRPLSTYIYMLPSLNPPGQKRPTIELRQLKDSFVDLNTNLILMVVNMNKRMRGIGTEGKSGRMEKEGVREGLKRIAALMYKIRSVCSDNDAKIGKMLREDVNFKNIKHLLDFWHLIKGINHDLRELAKKKGCPNIQFWRRKIINHAYFVHFKFARNRKRGLNYWLSILAHVTGRHSNLHKIPFLDGVTKCKHAKIGRDTTHLIKRDSDEFQKLKAVIMKPTFLSGFLRASPKKNTSPNESFNSIINMYAPKKNASTPPWYEERVKLATLHFNTLSFLNMLDLREETYDTSVKVIGRDSRAVKRKMGKANHAWRNEVWEAIPDVIDGRIMEQFMKRMKAPSNQAYIRAMQNEEEDEEEEREEEDGDGGESDVSEELGGGMYGEQVDSDEEPAMHAIELSDVEDEESEEEGGEGEEGAVEEEEESIPYSGSEWDEGEAAVRAQEAAARGRGRGRGGRGGRGRGGGRVGAVSQPLAQADLNASPTSSRDAQPSTKKKMVKRSKEETATAVDSDSDSQYTPTPAKKGKGKLA